ncbi:unnamed protein product [Lathyrus sativus]|nr:unnamed protein product [Lathyrus sativus]
MSGDFLPENSTVVGCGAVGLDFLATVAAYPKPDQKIRSTSFKVCGKKMKYNMKKTMWLLGFKPRSPRPQRGILTTKLQPHLFWD